MAWWKFWRKPVPVESTPVKPRRRANWAARTALAMQVAVKSYNYPIQPPALMPGVVPKGMTAKAAIAMDAESYDYARIAYGSNSILGFAGFPGYPYLASLAVRAEYRAFASAISTEITREWISLQSTETASDQTKQRVTELSKKIKDIGLRSVIRRTFEHDSLYGRGQVFIELRGQDPNVPLILSSKTIAKNSFVRVANVEPMWTTPVSYNSNNPIAPDFYTPSRWFILGKQVHASRLPTVITREVPDMLKPAFNFGGISLSQLAEPYVDNWLRTRQSVSDLIANFSTTALKTSMDQMLDGGIDDAGEAGEDLLKRADYFTLLRNNKGLMLLDNENEDLVQLNTPLGGLHELQAQAQEQMCSVSHVPAIILTGISPSGLNASSEGEIRCWEDWIAAYQEAFARGPIETVLQVLQYSMWGEVDPDILMVFEPLRQMTAKELAEIRNFDAQAGAAYIDRGVISPEEERERLARDPESGYQGLDMSMKIEEPSGDEEDDDEE